MRPYATVNGDNPQPQLVNFDHDDNDDDRKAKEAEAASIITLSCSPGVRCIFKGIRNLHRLWITLETSLDSVGFYMVREDILLHFPACRPTEDEPLTAYFTMLSTYHRQLDHTNNAITDRDFRTQIFTSLPSLYAMIFMVRKHRRPLPTPDHAMHDLLEEQTTASLTKELRDAYTGAALLSQLGGYPGRGKGYG